MAIARVQGNSNRDFTGGAISTLSATVSAIASGSLVVGYATAGENIADLRVLDELGNPCTMGTATYDATNNQTAQGFYRENITNAPTTFTLSRTGGGSITYSAITVDEFSGVATSSALSGTPAQQVQNSPGTGTDGITSGNTTPAVNGCLIYGWTQNDGGSTQASAGTGYTSATSETTAAGRSEYKVQATAAAVAATFTTAANESHITGVMAFKPLVTGTTLTADSGSFSLTGVAASLRPARVVTGGVGSFTHTGNAANLTYNNSPVNYTLTAQLGTISLNLQDATLTHSVLNPFSWDRVVGNEGYEIEWGQTSGGPYPNSGTNATDDETYDIYAPYRTTWYARVAALLGGVPQEYSTERVFTSGIPDLDADIVSFSATGIDAGLKVGRVVAASVGSFTDTGIATSLIKDSKLVASAVSFSVSGSDANLAYQPASSNYSLSANTGVFSQTGVSAVLARGLVLPIDAGSMTLTGYSAGLTYSGVPSSGISSRHININIGISL